MQQSQDLTINGGEDLVMFEVAMKRSILVFAKYFLMSEFSPDSTGCRRWTSVPTVKTIANLKKYSSTEYEYVY